MNSNTLWTGAYSYDQYGNFTCGPGSLNGICISFSPDSSSNRMVQISGSNQTYDAAGEVVQSVDSSGTNNYTWDAEGRLANIDGGSFTWNALGWLAEDNLEIMHGAWGGTLGWVTADGSTWYQQFVPFPGRKALGFYYGGLWAPFDHPNALGSTQMATMANGGAMADYELYPWGDVWQETGTTNYDENFGGMLRQFNQYYLTRFRRYLVPKGRWLTPDPMGGEIANPQSLNRYAYVMNNPTTFTDPLGLCSDPSYAVCKDPPGVANPGNPFNISITSVLAQQAALQTIQNMQYLVEQIDESVANALMNASGQGPRLGIQGGGGGSGGNGTASASVNKPKCPSVPAHPPNANVDSNIQQAQVVRDFSFLNPPTYIATTYSWFVAHVAPHRSWDYKTQGIQYAAFGNFNYGATGAALGIPLQGLQMAGGLVAQTVGTHLASWGNWYQPPEYGHDPVDVEGIAAGYEYYQQGCHQ